jgi:DNA polymerase III subunit gamma/tau
MSQALYRKYRPRSLKELVGQEHITELLSSSLKRSIFSHAYLFTGPRGVGKTSVARILAHALNNLSYSEDNNLDIIEIDAASNRRIDDIRDLRDKIHIAPTSSKYKVYIIDEVHMLTTESFNALLKTLEEPPEHVIFILATTEVHKLPLTIISRTQRFHFRPVEVSKVATHLRQIADSEKIKIDNQALNIIAARGGGSFRDSIGLLDQIGSSREKTITSSDIEQLLGLAPIDTINRLLASISNFNQDEAVEITQNLLQEGNSPQTIVDQILLVLPDFAQTAPHLYKLLDNLLDVNRSYRPDFKLLALIANSSRNPDQTNVPLKKAQKSENLTPSPSQLDLPKKPENNIADDTSSSTDNKFDLQILLDTLQKRDTSLFNLVNRADVSFSSQDNNLTLKFKFKLHRKKLENVKTRNQLLGIFKATFDFTPDLTVIDATSAPLEGPAADIAAIMGGGEAIDI